MSYEKKRKIRWNQVGTGGNWLKYERSVREGTVGGAHYCFVWAASLHLILACGRGFFGHYWYQSHPTAKNQPEKVKRRTKSATITKSV